MWCILCWCCCHMLVESILSLITTQQEFIIIIQILHHPASPLILQLQLRLLMLLLYTSENVESVSKVLTCLITFFIKDFLLSNVSWRGWKHYNFSSLEYDILMCVLCISYVSNTPARIGTVLYKHPLVMGVFEYRTTSKGHNYIPRLWGNSYKMFHKIELYILLKHRL